VRVWFGAGTGSGESGPTTSSPILGANFDPNTLPSTYDLTTDPPPDTTPAEDGAAAFRKRMYEIRRRIAIGTRNGQRSASSDYDTGTDLDCADIGHQVEIDDGDPDGLDADGDGIGCEAYPP
jgi:hypothetical protein